jgi:hypothetical protein
MALTERSSFDGYRRALGREPALECLRSVSRAWLAHCSFNYPVLMSRILETGQNVPGPKSSADAFGTRTQQP